MNRVHIALNTNAFEKSVDFYTKILGLSPAKLREGYAKFDSLNPPVNLTLNYTHEPVNSSAINHLGVEVEDTDTVKQMTQRLIESGLVTRVEEDTDCCYALQDKVWVTDPNGYQWEFFFVKQQNTDEVEIQEA